MSDIKYFIISILLTCVNASCRFFGMQYDLICASDSDTNFNCWGKYENSNLGTATTTQTSPYAMNFNHKIKKMAVGGHHGCFIDEFDDVYCWGSNNIYQSGGNVALGFSTPNKVALSNVTEISAGLWHTCAITFNKDLYCWGTNGNGQFGNNSTSSGTSTPTYSRSNVIKVRCVGGGNTVIMDVNNNVFSAGYGGKNGDNTTTEQHGFVQILSNVKDIFGGSYGACALLLNGETRCWGSNVYGQLGQGNTNVLTSTYNIGISNVIDVAIGARHICVINSAGNVYCSGSNEFGQVGQPLTTTQLSTFTLISTSITGVDKIIGGYYATCMSIDTDVKCFGRNEAGEFGDGTTTDSYTPVLSNQKCYNLEFMNEKLDIPAFVQPGDNFGASMAVSNGYLLVGTDVLSKPGYVVEYKLVDERWIYRRTITNGTIGDNFGKSVELYDSYYAIGAPGSNTIYYGSLVSDTLDLRFYNGNTDSLLNLGIDVCVTNTYLFAIDRNDTLVYINLSYDTPKLKTGSGGTHLACESNRILIYRSGYIYKQTLTFSTDDVTLSYATLTLNYASNINALTFQNQKTLVTDTVGESKFYSAGPYTFPTPSSVTSYYGASSDFFESRAAISDTGSKKIYLFVKESDTSWLDRGIVYEGSDSSYGTVVKLDNTRVLASAPDVNKVYYGSTTTLGPTVSPTANPTFNPTVNPTTSPTAGPTTNPTATPTVSPTAGPTYNPTTNPTTGPTTSPTTATPTVSPTADPTTNPTVGPTVSPTRNPSGGPTTNPTTATPTLSPTMNPSGGPTTNPTTATPTVSTTMNPSGATTTNPTTAIPTVSPTMNPSGGPTTNPTTATPTVSPTTGPTTSPTMNPSGGPTANPTTGAPTLSPTLNPSGGPTANPTTGAPTLSPTMNPSVVSTNNPTTRNPSESPTSNPTTRNPTTVTPTMNPITLSPTSSPTESTEDKISNIVVLSVGGVIFIVSAMFAFFIFE